MFRETTKKLTCPRPLISALVDHKRHSEAFHFGLGLDRESDFVLQVVIPAQGLLLRSVSVHDEFVLDAVLSEGILFTFRHRRHSSFRRQNTVHRGAPDLQVGFRPY